MYCDCYPHELKYEVIPISIEEWKRPVDARIETSGRLPDFCDVCKKPFKKRSIEISFEDYTGQQRQRLADVERMVRERDAEHYQ